MANLTLAIDDEVLRRARIRALEQGTSVNALLREYLDAYSGVRAERMRAIEEFLRIVTESGARRGEKTWTRDDLHDRDALR